MSRANVFFSFFCVCVCFDARFTHIFFFFSLFCYFLGGFSKDGTFASLFQFVWCERERGSKSEEGGEGKGGVEGEGEGDLERNYNASGQAVWRGNDSRQHHFYYILMSSGWRGKG